MAQYWLMKSEPDSYSIEQFAKDKNTLWTGVRNYQARNFMMDAMKPGDLFFFYHSNAEPSGIVGIGKITKVAVVDPTALDRKSDYFDPKSSTEKPIWYCAEVQFIKKFKSILSLQDLKAQKNLSELLLLQKGQRLSVQPVSATHFQIIEKLAQS